MDIIYIEDIPQDCIDDCSQPGPADAMVQHWRTELDFTVDREKAINCLKEYGAWTIEELEEKDNDDLAETILWLVCGNFKEYQLDDGAGNCGSDIFCLSG